MHGVTFPTGRRLDCVSLGRLCIDLNANEIHRPLEQTMTFTKYVGGSPANITIAMSRLGLKTGFIGRVSDDAFGRFITSYLEANDIDTGNVVIDRSGGVTGLAFTEIKSPTECSILMYRDNAADLKLEPGDVQESVIADSKALLISGTAVACSPSREAVFQALDYAERHGVTVFFDIDYRPYTWVNRTETGIYYRLAAERSHVIIGGREEFDLMEPEAGISSEGSPVERDARTARIWFEHKAQIVVVKRGGDGSVAFTKDGNSWQGRTFPNEVVKTFGAGDAFAGAFIYGLMQDWPVNCCQEYGALGASIVVGSHSCSDAMPTREQLESHRSKYE